MPAIYFPVTGILKAVITDTSGDADGDPDIQNITATVTFTPSVKQVYSTMDGTIYRLAPIEARSDPEDGVIRTIDGNEVSLVANSAEFDIVELTYAVTFTNVTYDEDPVEIEPFRFRAPNDDTPVDLATVNRIPL